MAVAHNGVTLPLIEVVSATLRHLKTSALRAISDVNGSPISADEVRLGWLHATPLTAPPPQVRWVLTVPAIWLDGAKAFMRNAAFSAGCGPQPVLRPREGADARRPRRAGSSPSASPAG